MLPASQKRHVDMKKTTSNSPIPGDTLEWILSGLAPVPLAAARKIAMKKALLSRVGKTANRAVKLPGGDNPIQTVRAGDGVWRPLAPSVEMQILFDDGVTASWLARVMPGGRLPAHDHAHGPEECLVVSGSCHLDDVFLQAGDYQLAPVGSRHVNIYSDTGCVLFLRSPSFKSRTASAHA